MNERAQWTTPRRVTLFAIVAIAAAGLAIPVLRTQLEPAPDTPPPPSTTSELPTTPDLGLPDPPIVYYVDFAGPNRGFALWGQCTNGEDYRCNRKLMVSGNGAGWTPRPFPYSGVAAPYPLSGRIIALGADEVVLADLDPSGSRLHTGDRGQTWQEVSMLPRDTVAEIPPGGVLESQCVELAGDPIECPNGTVTVIRPGSGQPAWLATAPPLAQTTPEPLPAADGSWWASGRDPATMRWAVAVSRDAGRTWSTSVLPVEGRTQPSALSIAANGNTVYVVGTAPNPDGVERRSLIAIFQSTDGGRTWRQTRQADGRSPRSLGGTPVITPDGGLFIATDDVGPCYRSTDGGQTFSPVLDGPRLTSIRRTRAGYLGMVSEGPPDSYLSSADGVRWTDVVLP